MTDRIMVYPGAIPLETDLLNSNKFAMMGLAKLSAAIMGSTTYLHGLQCTPSSPASMVVNVAKGQIYSLQNVDNTAYSSLAADTVNTILKQGVILASTAFTLTAPTTAGQSINYLIQVTYTDTDTGSTVLPYYNAANPSVAYSGPNNSGAAQNTVRSGVCTVALKAGVAATTGTQTTPAADTGYTAAWVITVAQGATTVTSTNISVAANAPFLPASGIVSAIQQCAMTYAADTGAANAYVAQFLPALPTLADGMRLTFKAKVANTGASTFAANGGSAYPLYSHANQALQGGEIIANGIIEVEWNSTLTAWVMCGNSGGATPVATAYQSNQAVNLGQLLARPANFQRFTTSGSFTVPPGITSLIVSGCGGGGGGGGSQTSISATVAGSGGGGGGAFATRQLLTVTPGQLLAVTIGGGGAGGAAGGGAGGAGGTTIMGTIVNLVGGGGGSIGQSLANTASGGTPGSAAGSITGGWGGDSQNIDGGGAYGGQGGACPFGAAGAMVRGNSIPIAGQNGIGFGAGGSGAGGGNTNAAHTGAAGGAGAPGLLIIEW